MPVGSKVYVREYATDNHYLINDKKYLVEFEYSGQDVVEYKSEGNTSYSVVNSMTHYLNEKGELIKPKI